MGEAIRILYDVLKAVSRQTIISCFHKAGFSIDNMGLDML